MCVVVCAGGEASRAKPGIYLFTLVIFEILVRFCAYNFHWFATATAVFEYHAHHIAHTAPTPHCPPTHRTD